MSAESIDVHRDLLCILVVDSYFSPLIRSFLMMRTCDFSAEVVSYDHDRISLEPSG